jgi:hypothetical protein
MTGHLTIFSRRRLGDPRQSTFGARDSGDLAPALYRTTYPRTRNACESASVAPAAPSGVAPFFSASTRGHSRQSPSLSPEVAVSQ